MVIPATIVTGLLLYAAFAPLAFWFCAPLALAALLHLLHDRSTRMKLAILFCFGASFFLPLLSWSNTYVGNIPWLILTTLQISFLLPIAFIPFASNKPWLTFVFPPSWVAMEWCAANIPFGGFGWGRVGFSQADAPFAVFAKFGGVPLLSFFVASVSVALYFLAKGERGEIESKLSKKIGRMSGGVLAGFVLLALLSPSPQWKNDFAVVGVQGGVPKLGLDFNERAAAVFDLHLSATSKYLEKTKKSDDLVVWPENAVDIDPFTNVDISRQLDDLTAKFDIPIVVGAVTGMDGKFYNESILWAPGRGAINRYTKQHLTPFGEFIPLRSLAEFVSPYAKNVTDFYPGNDNAIHEIGPAKIAPVICYELLDDGLGRSINSQSNLMLVQTNSATFGLSEESAQQLNITRIRAIEHQRFVVSISTAGISAFIDPQGAISQKTNLDESRVIRERVGLVSTQSFSDRYGSPIEALLIAPALLMMGRALVRRSRKGPPSTSA